MLGVTLPSLAALVIRKPKPPSGKSRVGTCTTFSSFHQSGRCPATRSEDVLKRMVPDRVCKSSLTALEYWPSPKVVSPLSLPPSVVFDARSALAVIHIPHCVHRLPECASFGQSISGTNLVARTGLKCSIGNVKAEAV